MSTDEIIRSLHACGGLVPKCEGCVLRGRNRPLRCFDELKILAAKELDVLQLENKYLRENRNEKP